MWLWWNKVDSFTTTKECGKQEGEQIWDYTWNGREKVKRPRWILLQIPSCPIAHLGAGVLQAMHESYKNLMFLERDSCLVFVSTMIAWRGVFDGWNILTALLMQRLGFRQMEANSQLVFIHQHIFLLMPTRQRGTGCFRSLFFYNLRSFFGLFTMSLGSKTCLSLKLSVLKCN